MDFSKQLVWTCKPKKFWESEHCTSCCKNAYHKPESLGIYIKSSEVNGHQVDFYACNNKTNNNGRKLIVAILGSSNPTIHSPAPMGWIDEGSERVNHSYGDIWPSNLYKEMLQIQKAYYKLGV